ncbi:hypothetical protein HX99_03745 [Peptococcaceae bacterium SCADC1_2_3]|nr:hypothetical protein HX99_03745 [Peptococcaceae bacterium SCADC1_2_3]
MDQKKDGEVALITGAGFSIPGGMPSQSSILEDIENYTPDVMESGGLAYNDAKQYLHRFLNAIFFGEGDSEDLKDENAKKLANITLEDIYTILDRSVLGEDVLPPFSFEELQRIRSSVDACVVYYFNSLQDKKKQEGGELYEKLYSRLEELYGDKWATVSINWDTIWDNVIVDKMGKKGFYIDYGGPVFRIESNCMINPSKEQLGLKLLKLHGSFNWLECPRCHTLFASRDNLGWRGCFDPIGCPRCICFTEEVKEPRLRALFLTPTMLKKIKNPTLQIIWDEAIHILSNAREIFFIGYSFPFADYELRYLFRRSIPHGTKIKVVLHKDDAGADMLERNKHLLPVARYKSLFRLSDEDFYYEGFEKFFGLD